MLCAVPAFAQSIVVGDAYIRELPPGQDVTAMFFTLTNNSSTKSCELIGAATAVAGSAEIHVHHHHNGMMQMRQVESVVVPADEVVEFQPGGYHLMLFGVQQPLMDGESYPVTLFFRGCTEQIVMAEVRSVLQ